MTSPFFIHKRYPYGIFISPTWIILWNTNFVSIFTLSYVNQSSRPNNKLVDHPLVESALWMTIWMLWWSGRPNGTAIEWFDGRVDKMKSHSNYLMVGLTKWKLGQIIWWLGKLKEILIECFDGCVDQRKYQLNDLMVGWTKGRKIKFKRNPVKMGWPTDKKKYLEADSIFNNKGKSL